MSIKINSYTETTNTISVNAESTLGNQLYYKWQFSKDCSFSDLFECDLQGITTNQLQSNSNQQISAQEFSAMAETWTQKGEDIDGEAAGDYSGTSVSLSSDGRTVAIGAHLNDGNGYESGHVRVYRWNGSAWNQIGQDIDGEAFDRNGYSVSLSSDGNTVAIGTPFNDGNGNQSGHVEVYSWDGSVWTQLGVDFIGERASLSSDGNTIAIGEYSNDSNGSNAGSVRVYSWSGSAWTQLGSDIDGEAAGDLSGFSVSLSSDGNTVAIGAPYNDGNGTSSGHVRIYRWSGSAWTQLGVDIDGEAAGDQSSWSVSLSSDGNTVAIGAYLNDGNGDQSGHVRVYRWNGSVWNQIGQDIDGEADYDASGYSVSLSSDGSRVAIGAYFNDGNGNQSGHVRVYSWSGSAWTQLGSDIDGEAADDKSGISVSLSSDGNTVAIGAQSNDGNGAESGHVRVYEIEPTPEPTPNGSTINKTESGCYRVIVYDNKGHASITDGIDEIYNSWNIFVSTDFLQNNTYSVIINSTDNAEISIDWGDGTTINYTESSIVSHSYQNEGVYNIKIRGSLGTSGNIKLTNGVISVGSIPAIEGWENFEDTFLNCHTLQAVPADLFINYEQAFSFTNTFKNCNNLTILPENLFAKNTNFISMDGIFNGISINSSDYSRLLRELWNLAKDNNIYNVVFDGGNSRYLESVAEYRNILTKSISNGGYNWTILDGGMLRPEIVFDEQPQNQIFNEDNDPTFNVLARDINDLEADITYQWQKYISASSSWQDIPEQTENTLRLYRLSQSDNNNQYRVVVKSDNGIVQGEAISNHVTIEYRAFEPPVTQCLDVDWFVASRGIEWFDSNDEISDGTKLTLSNNDSGLVNLDGNCFNAIDCDEYGLDPGVLYRTGPTSATSITFTFSKPIENPLLYIGSLGNASYTGTISPSELFVIECNKTKDIGCGSSSQTTGVYEESNILYGREGFGIIRFPGIHQQITILFNNREYAVLYRWGRWGVLNTWGSNVDSLIDGTTVEASFDSGYIQQNPGRFEDLNCPDYNLVNDGKFRYHGPSSATSDPSTPGNGNAKIINFTFSEPIQDLLFYVSSLGSPGNNVNISFYGDNESEFSSNKLFQIECNDVTGSQYSPIQKINNTTISASEGYGIIRFPGVHKRISVSFPQTSDVIYYRWGVKNKNSCNITQAVPYYVSSYWPTPNSPQINSYSVPAEQIEYIVTFDPWGASDSLKIVAKNSDGLLQDSELIDENFAVTTAITPVTPNGCANQLNTCFGPSNNAYIRQIIKPQGYDSLEVTVSRNSSLLSGYYLNIRCENGQECQYEEIIYDCYYQLIANEWVKLRDICGRDGSLCVCVPPSSSQEYSNGDIVGSYCENPPGLLCGIGQKVDSFSCSCVPDENYEPPEQPPITVLECSSGSSYQNDNSAIESINTIKGYAFYFPSKKQTVEIGGNSIEIPCGGGHVCNGAIFRPLLTFSDGSFVEANKNINLNNSGQGEDYLGIPRARSDIFEFDLSLIDKNLLSDKILTGLRCETGGRCHNGITNLVLTAIIGGEEIIIFNDCLVPSPLGIEFDIPVYCKGCEIFPQNEYSSEGSTIYGLNTLVYNGLRDGVFDWIEPWSEENFATLSTFTLETNNYVSKIDQDLPCYYQKNLQTYQFIVCSGEMLWDFTDIAVRGVAAEEEKGLYDEEICCPCNQLTTSKIRCINSCDITCYCEYSGEVDGQIVNDYYKTDSESVCVDTYNGLPLISVAGRECFEYCTDCNSEAFINNGVELKNNQIVIPKPNWLK